MSLSYPGLCMHEVLFDDRFLAETGVTTLDFAKAMIDEGVHPMTMYFPLIVHGAFLIEPTETESKETLDSFAEVLFRITEESADLLHEAPHTTPISRPDEVRAARQPVIKWSPSATSNVVTVGSGRTHWS